MNNKTNAQERLDGLHRSDHALAGVHSAKGELTFVSLFQDYRVALVIGSVFLLLTNAAALSIPRMIKHAVDAIAEQQPFAVMNTSIMWIIGLAIAGGLARVLSRMYIFNIGRDIERDIRSVIFRHVLTMSSRFFEQFSIGDVMSRLTNDLQSIRALSGFALLNVINAIFIFVGTLPVLFQINTKLTLLALIPFPLGYGAAQRRFSTMENQKQLGVLNTILQQNLNGQTIVRAFDQQEPEIEKFEVANIETFNTAMRLAMIRMVLFPLMGLMSALSISIALYVGGTMAAEGILTVGDIVEFNTRIMQLAWPAMAGGFIIAVYHRGRASLARVNEMLSMAPDIYDGEYAEPISGALRLRNVSKSFERDGHVIEALKNISVDIVPGEFIGVIGTNASGKSTLVDVVTRQFDVSSGEVCLDEHGLAEWNIGALRDGFAVVPEQAFLFSKTIRENLKLWNDAISDEEIHDVLSMVDLMRDLSTFPDGLDTMVGERGWTLSGGQRQRVALARALLKNAPILILDDALSAVDAEVESHIISALRDGSMKRQNQTLIVIAHRPEAIRTADRILVFRDGEIVQTGTHQDLASKDGLYRQLLTDREEEADKPKDQDA